MKRLLLTASLVVIPKLVMAQVFLGGGAGLTFVPHTGQTNCYGMRRSITTQSAELRVGTTTKMLDLSVRGSRVFGIDNKYIEDCIGSTTFTDYSYAHEKQHYAVDVNAWYRVRRYAKLGGEMGYFPGSSKYAGAGAAISVYKFDLEGLGRLYKVDYVERVFQVNSGTSAVLLSKRNVHVVKPGFSVRLVWVAR